MHEGGDGMTNEEQIQWVKNTFRKGMRIRLKKMDDFQAPPIGTEGTVLGVDDIGSVMVAGILVQDYTFYLGLMR